MMEIWHPCAGYETHYEVSNLGNVRSIERMVNNRVNSGLRKSPQKLLKQGKSKSGYYIVSFCVDGVKSNQTVHRLVARAFIPNESNKPQVNHKDGNKHNNHLDNLEWVTVSENSLHYFNHIKPMKFQAINDQQAQTITALTARIVALEEK
jgi:NUMOD4 motif/HNH endonuclease